VALRQIANAAASILPKERVLRMTTPWTEFAAAGNAQGHRRTLANHRAGMDHVPPLSPRFPPAPFTLHPRRGPYPHGSFRPRTCRTTKRRQSEPGRGTGNGSSAGILTRTRLKQGRSRQTTSTFSPTTSPDKGSLDLVRNGFDYSVAPTSPLSVVADISRRYLKRATAHRLFIDQCCHAEIPSRI
jgi:hypothetical protein